MDIAIVEMELMIVDTFTNANLAIILGSKLFYFRLITKIAHQKKENLKAAVKQIQEELAQNVILIIIE